MECNFEIRYSDTGNATRSFTNTRFLRKVNSLSFFLYFSQLVRFRQAWPFLGVLEMSYHHRSSHRGSYDSRGSGGGYGGYSNGYDSYGGRDGYGGRDSYGGRGGSGGYGKQE